MFYGFLSKMRNPASLNLVKSIKSFVASFRFSSARPENNNRRSILLCCIQTSNSSTCIVGRQDCQISFYAKLDSKVSKAAALRAQTDNCPPQECNAWKQV